MPAWLIALLIGLSLTVVLALEQSRPALRYTPRRSRVSGGWLFLLSALGLTGGLAWLMVTTYRQAESPPAPALTPATTESAPTLASAHLKIAALGLDAPISRVPVVNHQWDISRLSAQVGWLEGTGQQPGDDTAIVLIGHVTLSAQERGPFADLGNLTPLTQVVYQFGGREFVFAVSNIQKVNADSVDELYRWGGDHLLLVTCTNWNYFSEKYNRRLLVDAVLVKTNAQ